MKIIMNYYLRHYCDNYSAKILCVINKNVYKERHLFLL